MKSMQCSRVSELLSPYLDNELDAVTTLDVARHLETCSGCRQEIRHLTEINGFVKQGGNAEENEVLATRAAIINGRVRERILAETMNPRQASAMEDPDPSAEEFFTPPTVQSAPGVKVFPLARMRRVWRVVKKLAVAAAMLIVVGLGGLLGLMYWAHSTGPLLAATVRTHRVCIRAEGLGMLKGNQPGEQLMSRMKAVAPQLSQAGLKLEDGHLCKIYNAPFVHLVYLKDGKPVSVFYGAKEAVARLCETEGKVTPCKIYRCEESGVRVAALTTGDGENLWIVAGELSESEMQAITAKLSSDTVALR